MTVDLTYTSALDPRVQRLMRAVQAGGITDARVLAAMAAVPRDAFVPRVFADQAYDDVPLPIAAGQTISQPVIVAGMTEVLAVEDHHKVLEIGTGSGYQTAILAQLGRRVYTVERYQSLLDEALGRLSALGIANVIACHGDGGLGWPENAPFDRILVTAACPDEPKTLLDQLRIGGICVAPVVSGGSAPDLVVYRRIERGFDVTVLGPAPFVPLVAGIAAEG